MMLNNGNQIINFIRRLILEDNLKQTNQEIFKIILGNLNKKIENFSELEKKINFLKNGKIPEMDYIMLEMNFRFKNIFWNNSTAYVKINNEYHWMEHHNWETSSCNLDNWVSPIRIILKRKDIDIVDKKGELNIIFGIKPDITMGKINDMRKCEIKDFDFTQMNIAEFVNLRISIK